MGSNPTLNNDIQNFGSIGSYATNLGQNNLNSASSFWSGILSGDPSKVAQVLAPEISAAQGQGSQAKKTSAEFGTRSGGTASSNASIDAGTRGNLINLQGSLMSQAANGLGNLGTTSLSTGLNAYGQQVNASQLQMSNWQNGILGGALSGAVAGGLGLGTLGLGESFGLIGKPKSSS